MCIVRLQKDNNIAGQGPIYSTMRGSSGYRRGCRCGRRTTSGAVRLRLWRLKGPAAEGLIHAFPRSADGIMEFRTSEQGGSSFHESIKGGAQRWISTLLIHHELPTVVMGVAWIYGDHQKAVHGVHDPDVPKVTCFGGLKRENRGKLTRTGETRIEDGDKDKGGYLWTR